MAANKYTKKDKMYDKSQKELIAEAKRKAKKKKSKVKRKPK